MNPNGPWTEVLYNELKDTRRMNPIPSNKFSIKPTVAKFVKFTLLSYWGHGGGLQYFSCQPGEQSNIGLGSQNLKSNGKYFGMKMFY